MRCASEADHGLGYVISLLVGVGCPGQLLWMMGGSTVLTATMWLVDL